MTKAAIAPLAIIAIVFALLWPTAYTIVYFLGASGFPPAFGQAVYSIGKAIQFVFPVAWLLLYERKRLGPDLPKLAPRRRGASAAYGIVFGLFVGAAMLAGYYFWLRPLDYFAGAAELVREKLDEFQISTPGRYLALAVFYSLLHSALEEYYWRWFVFRRLSWLTPAAPAIAISSVGFMAHHIIPLCHYFPGEKLPAALFFTLSVGVGGAVWAWLYARYQSLLGPWLSHLIVDAAIFAIGYDLVKGISG